VGFKTPHPENLHQKTTRKEEKGKDVRFVKGKKKAKQDFRGKTRRRSLWGAIEGSVIPGAKAKKERYRKTPGRSCTRKKEPGNYTRKEG